MKQTRLTRDESKRTRGASIVIITIALVAMMAAVAIAVDIGMLLNARGEAQRAADAAALAGAGSLIMLPNDETRARQFATDWAAQNTVTDIPVTLLPEDIDVDLARSRVTVTVRRFADRGLAVGTWFARVFGVNEVDVAARAAAEAQPTGSARCVKPFAIPDAWDDANADSLYQAGEAYDTDIHGWGTDWRNPGQPGDDGQGYINDFGRRISIKEGGPLDEPFQAGWYYPWDIPQPDGGPATGGDRYRSNIAACNPMLITIGEEYMVENGNMPGPTSQGVEDLIATDPGAYWDEASGQVMGSQYDPSWESSPRVGIVPTFDPARIFDPGKDPISFTNFIAVFFESVEGTGQNQYVWVRILNPSGVAGGEATGGILKAVRLVE